MKKATKRGWKSKSRILVWMLIISMIVTALPVQQATAAELSVQQAAASESSGFQDVRPTDWFYEAAVYVRKNGIFSGTGGGLFSPKGTMTRAMYVTALGRMAGVDVSEYSASSFADVPAGIWYAPYVAWAVKKGIAGGTGGRNFSPDATVSREQMATLILRYFESYQIPYQSSNRITTEPSDLANVSSWAADAVVRLWQEGLFAGDSNGNFNPHGQASRAEAAILFMRSNAVVEAWANQNQETPTPTPSPTPTPTPGAGGNSGGGNAGGNSGGGNEGSTGIEYTLTFESNGGTAVAAQTVKDGSVAVMPEVPTRTGYPFGGWYSDSNLTIPYGFTEAVTGDMTLYAKWIANYTVSFDSNGGSAVAAQTVQEGGSLSRLPAPAKDGYIFQGWFRDNDLSLIFTEGSTVTADTKLYAKYIDNVSNAVRSTPSYSVLDVAPSFTIAIADATGSLTASEVQELMKFEDTSNPDFTGISVTGANGLFSLAAKGGQFTEGHTYQLTLTDDNLSFQGQDATTRIYVFSVAKEEVMVVPLNPNMIYLPFADVTNMMLNGKDVNSPAIPVVTTTVGDSENGLAAANAGGGTFEYTGSAAIRVGDTVAIYEGVRPDLRTVDTTGADDGAVAYVQITAMNGNTYTYDHADAKQVLFKPDVLPVSVEADTDGDPGNHSITVEHIAMNYSDSQYASIGLNELTTVDVGDFIAFYEGELAEGAVNTAVVGYGRITSITPVAEMDVIAYTDVTEEDIAHIFDVYQQQAIDGDQLLSDEEIAQLEDQIKQQAIASGFVDQAANYLSALAMETNGFKTQMEVNMLSASKGAGKVSVENLTVVPSLGTRVKHIAGQTSGVSATLQIGADIVIRIHEESDLVIHMTGTFLQEIALNLGINGGTEWGEACVWFLCVPYPRDYRITANLDAYTYTGINVTAEIATVEHDKLQDALDDWDKAATGGMLGKVRDIATEIKALIDGVQDTSVDAESLKAQYQEMMENETDWVPLIKKKLFEKSVRVVYGIIEVNFEANFVVSANVNLTIGADFNYTTAKRYSVTVHVLGFRGSSGTVSLPGDGNYQFTFYVMGTLGLRAGVLLELKAGVGSVELNSIGVSIEAGAYVNLWGYFYYQLKQLNGEQTTRSMGALYVEIGIYLETAIGAQLGDGMLSGSIPVYENTWPLYTVGEQRNVVEFAYPQDEAPELNLAGSASSLTVPKMLLEMSMFDLKSGGTDTQTYDASRFDIQVDHANFKYDPATRKIEVLNTNSPLSKGNLVITWKGAPLSFGSEPLKRTIPVTWRIRAGEYVLQLDPQNGGVTEVIVGAPNTAISAATPVYPGYTFDGWFTEAVDGTKTTIPSRMPAGDLQLYAHWTANTNTPYTVQHYLIEPNSRTAASPAYTEILTGTTDTEIQINSDRFKGEGYANGTSSGSTIKGDGSAVVRVDYYPTNRTMTFNLNYAGAPAASITALFGKNIAARIPVPTRMGYTFAGWSPEAPSLMPTSDTTYTATWTARENTPYKVVYLKQNIASDTYTVADTESYYGITGAEANLTNVTLKSYPGFSFDNSVPGTVLERLIAGDGTTLLKVYYKRDAHTMTVDYNGSGVATRVIEVPLGATISLGIPTRQGYAFAGWLPIPPATMPAEDVQFTAQWTLNTNTVSFDSNGGSAVAAQTIGYGFLASEPVEPTKNDWVFGGWYSDSALTNAYDFATQVTGDLTLYAEWLRSYTVSFDSKGGSPVADQKVNEGTKAIAPDAPTLEEYVFSGWYRDEAFTTVYDFTTEVVTGDIELYAKWTMDLKTTYTVSFASNGGSTVEAQTVNEGAVAKAPAAPTRSGHTFGGWYSDSGLTSPYGFTAGVTEDLTLYAKWTKNSYTVSFNSNGGSTVRSQSVDDGDTAAKPADPTRSGHVFSGWYRDAGHSQAYSFTTPVTANVTLYAKWIATYTVSFESNGGSAVDAQTVNEGDVAAAPANPIRSGHSFDGWYSDSSLSEGYSFTTLVTENITLYAKWTENSYTVRFDSNGGSVVNSQTVSPGNKAAVPSAPTWKGYRFEGWYVGLNEGSPVYDFNTAVTADLTVYAKWTLSPWQNVGDTVGQVFEFKSALDSHDTPYVAGALDGTVYVMKYDGDEWVNIGSFAGARNQLEFAIDNADVPYIVYRPQGTYALVVSKYDASTGTWTPVGSDVLPSYTNNPSLAFDGSNVPYLAYVHNDGSSERTRVVKNNGTSWVDVAGGESLVSGWLPPIIKFSKGNIPYLYQKVLYGDATVSKYENGAWVTVSNLGSLENQALSFALDPNGVPYIVYRNNSTMSVIRYNVGSNNWGTIGTIATGNTGQSRSNIAFDSNGTPYVVYGYGNKATVMKYEGGSWTLVGNADFTETAAYQTGMTIDSRDSVYVFYVDNQPLGNPVNLTVMKHDSGK
ncbi:InlB B-repeat-containing protein [Cohnella herbarum]|uniref:SLH domain-containing protein n=1 Tax=Cohnella herbarum TaxID=2728023 RepID=A0A7Z2VK66_9BACL|nr:InlB B-repeat-containing protein [Cohnella herbarum]QJD84731.1 hypothetical protein HH215_17095 [Cohnella herbarum]